MSHPFYGIDHIGIAVTDLAAAEKTYSEILGFAVSGGERLEDRGIDVRFVETGNARIELLGELRSDSEISKFLQKRGEGIHHICVRVGDIEAAIADMQKRGARLASDGVQTGAHNTRVAFLHPKATHGVLIELVEHKGQ